MYFVCLLNLVSVFLAFVVRDPDRTTPIGQMINAFLQNTTDIDDRCVHLLFSANRWESE